MDNALEAAKEIVKIAQENNAPVQDLIKQYKKAQSQATKQGKEHTKTINEIIPQLIQKNKKDKPLYMG